MDKPCPRCHSMSLNSNMKHGQSKFLCGSVRRDNGRVEQSMICTRIERLEAKLERYEKALKDIASSGFAYIDKAEEIAEKALAQGEQDG